MAQTNFTPILLYGSSTPGNVPLAANLLNTTNGSEIAVNVADKNLFFKDSGGVVNTVPIRQSSTSSNGWLSSTDWNTFNNKTSNLGTVTSVAALTLGTTGTDLSSTVANGTTTPVITLNVPTASASNRGALSSTDWSTFNSKQAALVSGTNIKTVSGVSLLGSGDVGTIGVGYGGTGLTNLTAGYIPYGNGSSAFASSANLTYNGTGIGVNASAVGPLTLQGAAGTNGINQGIGFLYSTGTQFGAIGLNNSTGWPQIMARAGAGLTFHVNSDLLTTGEAMRIFSSGGVSIGNTTDPGAGSLSVTGNVGIANTVPAFKLQVGANSTLTGQVFKAIGGDGGSGTVIISCGGYAGTDVFRILGNGNAQNTNNSYGALSDAKLKENIVDATPKLADLMKVKIRNYNLIGAKEKQLGVVAQELEQIFPAMIDETFDTDSEGKELGTSTKSVKYSIFVPMLIKAIQEQQDIIEQLKQKVGL